MKPTNNTKRTAILRSLTYYANFIAMGCMLVGLGPTLPTLLGKAGVSIALLGTMFSARSIGSLLGSVISGWSYDKFNGHRIISIGLLLAAGTLTFFSGLTSFTSILIVVFLMGFSHGMIDVGCNTMLIWTHGDRVGPWMNGLHAFYGIGTFISPLVVTQSLIRTNDFAEAFRIFAIAFITLTIILNLIPAPKMEDAQEENSNYVPKPVKWNVLLAGMGITSLYVGSINAFDSWLFTYLTMKGVSELQAGNVSASFWGAFTISRLAFIFLSTKLKERQIVFGVIVGWFTSSILAFIFKDNITFLQLSLILLGASLAPLYATLMTVMKRNMDMTGKITSLFPVGNAIGMTILPFLAGVLYQYVAPSMFFLLVTISAAGSFGVALYLRPYMVFEE